MSITYKWKIKRGDCFKDLKAKLQSFPTVENESFNLSLVYFISLRKNEWKMSKFEPLFIGEEKHIIAGLA
jgi:hypothetical protein